MNQLERIREQCAQVADHCTHMGDVSAAIRALPLPEVNQEPVAWVSKETEEKLMAKDSRIAGFGASLFFSESGKYSIPLYTSPPDLHKETKAMKAVNAKPVGWCQYFNGDMTQNFARDEDELRIIKEIAQLSGNGAEFTYTPVFAVQPDVEALRKENDDLRKQINNLSCPVRLAEEWTEEDGCVIWYKFPINEPPHLGTPMDSGWIEDYFTHWQPLPKIPSTF